MANPELDQAEAHARVEAFERIGARLLEMEREAGHFGIPDCIDNAGRHYQSKAFESLISEVRALLSGSTPKPARVEIGREVRQALSDLQGLSEHNDLGPLGADKLRTVTRALTAALSGDA